MRCKEVLKEEICQARPNFETGEVLQLISAAGEVCNGPVKPNITFFGESLPEKMYRGWDKIRNKAMFSIHADPPPLFEDGGCDLMIVIGTALAVNPFNQTIYSVPDECPKVLINMTNNKDHGFDFDSTYYFPERLLLKGKCDDICQKIANDVQWSDELSKLIF